MKNASRREFDDALNSYHAQRSEFHADEWKNEVTSQAQGKERFLMIMCSVNSKFKSYVIYLTFTTCYVKGYQHVKNFNEDLYVCRSRNFEGYCRHLPTRRDRTVGFQHRAYITVNEQIARYVGVFFPLAITYVFTSTKRTSYLDTMYKSVRNLSWFCTGKWWK